MRGFRETHRNMDNIRRTACASRVFNLHDLTAALASETDDGECEPFFAHPALNRAIILKHRLRPDEGQLFAAARTVATKIFLPFDADDLSKGGRFVFIGERGWRQTYSDLFALDSGADDWETRRDLGILDIFDELPALEPFILRQRLKIAGISPPLAYFQLPAADYATIRDGVEREFLALARPEMRAAYRTQRGLGSIVRMMWDGREPKIVRSLLQTLRASPEEFAELMFAWKGFIYYKSLLPGLNRDWARVSRQIAAARVLGVSWTYRGGDLGSLRHRVLRQLHDELAAAFGTIRLYDEAYREGLLKRQDPSRFRAFLARTPHLLPQLGTAIAAVRHATTFWRYRFGDPMCPGCPAEELHDLLTDFSSIPAARPAPGRSALLSPAALSATS